jgi:competence protein ComEC
MTLPILIFTFGYIPVLALLANVLVAPVIPFAMLATFVAGCIGLVAPWLSLFAMPADIVIAYIVSIVQSLSGAEWAKVSFSLPSWSLFLWYGGLLVGGLLIWRRFKVDLMRGSVVE